MQDAGRDLTEILQSHEKYPSMKRAIVLGCRDIGLGVIRALAAKDISVMAIPDGIYDFAHFSRFAVTKTKKISPGKKAQSCWTSSVIWIRTGTRRCCYRQMIFLLFSSLGIEQYWPPASYPPFRNGTQLVGSSTKDCCIKRLKRQAFHYQEFFRLTALNP